MFEYMAAHQGKPEDLVSFTVQTHRGRGIYIREEAELIKKQQQFMVTITPQFVSNKGGACCNNPKCSDCKLGGATEAFDSACHYSIYTQKFKRFWFLS